MITELRVLTHCTDMYTFLIQASRHSYASIISPKLHDGLPLAVFAHHGRQQVPSAHCLCIPLKTPSLSFSRHPTNPWGRRVSARHPPVLSNILRQLIRSPVQLSRNQPKADLAAPVRVQIDLRQQRLPQILISNRFPSSIPPATLSPRVNVLRNALQEVSAVRSDRGAKPAFVGPFGRCESRDCGA
jgi:hypothetical protein